MKVIVAVASKHGAIAEIAEAISGTLQARGLEATLVERDQVPGLDRFDAVILGSAVYYGKWLSSARSFVTDRSAELASRPLWLFSCSPLGDPPMPDTDPDVLAAMAATGAREHHVFAGRTDRADLAPPPEGARRPAIPSPREAFRGRDAVTAWADHIADSLVGSVEREVATVS